LAAAGGVCWGGGGEVWGVVGFVSGFEAFGGCLGRWVVWKALSGGLGPVVLVVVERRAWRGRRNVGGSERMCGFD